MIGYKITPSNVSLGEIYEDNKDEDGFLYVTYTQNTFG